MDYQAFLKAADAGQAPPVTLLHGPEPFLLEDALDRATRALFPAGTDLALAREVLEAREAGAEGIVQAALTLPWMGGRRLVAVRGVQALAAKQAAALLAYLKAPNPFTVLLLLADESLDGDHWLLRALPPGAVVAVSAPSGRQLVSWLRQRARADGVEVTEDAAALLVELAGDDLARLMGEVAKAALAGGPDNLRVGLDEVRAVVGEHRLRHVFELTRAVVEGNAGAGLAVLESLLSSGEEPLAVLGMLARETREIWQVSEGLKTGRSPDELARALRRPGPAAAALVSRAQALPRGAAERRLERCWEVERRLKLGGQPRAELVLLVAELCTG